MFNKNGEAPTNAQRSDTDTTKRNPTTATSGIPSLISADLTIIGNLNCTGDIQIDGRVEGDIKSKTVTIGESAIVKGSVSADRATLLGTVEGQTRADQVIIAKTAKVVGDIVHRSLSVEAGAILDGHCRRFDSEEKETSKISPLKPNQPGSLAAAHQHKDSKPVAG